MSEKPPDLPEPEMCRTCPMRVTMADCKTVVKMTMADCWNAASRIACTLRGIVRKCWTLDIIWYLRNVTMADWHQMRPRRLDRWARPDRAGWAAKQGLHMVADCGVGVVADVPALPNIFEDVAIHTIRRFREPW